MAVMAHPSREKLVEVLSDRLDRDHTVVWDQRNDRWHTGSRAQLAWRTVDPDATHHLVVQDDAVVPRHLGAGIERALGYAPEGAALSLYLGRVRPFAGRIERAVAAADAQELPVSWFVMRELNWGVGVVLPTRFIDRMVHEQARVNVLEYDRRMSRWLVRHRIPVWYTWPSLVDHRDGPSLVAHGEGRHAYRFVGEDASALTPEWSGEALHVPDRRRQNQLQFPRRLEAAQDRRPTVERRP
jgi:hypothetical protein